MEGEGVCISEGPLCQGESTPGEGWAREGPTGNGNYLLLIAGPRTRNCCISARQKCFIPLFSSFFLVAEECSRIFRREEKGSSGGDPLLRWLTGWMSNPWSSSLANFNWSLKFEVHFFYCGFQPTTHSFDSFLGAFNCFNMWIVFWVLHKNWVLHKIFCKSWVACTLFKFIIFFIFGTIMSSWSPFGTIMFWESLYRLWTNWWSDFVKTCPKCGQLTHIFYDRISKS